MRFSVILSLAIVHFVNACIEYDTAYVGSPMGSNGIGRMDGVETEYECQSACQATPRCQFWVWNSPQWRARQKVCYFKSNDEGKREGGRAATGRISGPKVQFLTGNSLTFLRVQADILLGNIQTKIPKIYT